MTKDSSIYGFQQVGEICKTIKSDNEKVCFIKSIRNYADKK